eukprot:TRINITY_DN2453_c0_g1_i2.p1 TRINITY_DN2453_c0_g1~~TRINITY_DN2453_c0_g1_i2.p1  ORF type:complete len:347 (+),score=33.76 TRINITY_DN2453_c0_g1_i2:51-1091(+)
MMVGGNDEFWLRDIEAAWSEVLRRRSIIFAAGDSERTGCSSSSSSPSALVTNTGNDGKTSFGSSASHFLQDLVVGERFSEPRLRENRCVCVLVGQHNVCSAYAATIPCGSADEDHESSNPGDIKRAEGHPQAGTSTSGRTDIANGHTARTNESIELDLSFEARGIGDAAEEPSSFEENTNLGVQAASSAAPEPPHDPSTPIVEDEHANTRASVAASLDGATTIVVQNLPNFVTQDSFAQVIDWLGFDGKYDFLYVPVNFASGMARGYAFVNLLTDEIAVDFVIICRCQGFRCKRASVQGIDSYLSNRNTLRACSRIRNSSFKPLIRTNDSETQGRTVPEKLSQANR